MYFGIGVGNNTSGNEFKLGTDFKRRRHADNCMFQISDIHENYLLPFFGSFYVLITYFDNAHINLTRTNG